MRSHQPRNVLGRRLDGIFVERHGGWDCHQRVGWVGRIAALLFELHRVLRYVSYLTWPARFRSDLPDSLSIPGQIVPSATYIHPFFKSASPRVLIISQVAKAELAKIRQTVSTKSVLAGGGSVAVHNVR